MAMTTSAPPPTKGAKGKVEKPVDVKTTSAPAPGKPKEKEVTAGVCGDKGNPYYAEELRKAAGMFVGEFEQNYFAQKYFTSTAFW